MLLPPVEPAPAVVVATPTTAPPLLRWPGYPPASWTAHPPEEPRPTDGPVHRTVRAQHDGARRGDDAYQFLLHWAMEQTAGHRPAPSHPQEASPGSRSRQACRDQSSAPAADDGATPPPSARRRGAPPGWACGRRAYLSR